jgi:pimeloyl-ACP methyl ester carboxylesterase
MTDLEARDRETTFVSHEIAEHTVDLGEVRMNYVVEGNPEHPPILLIPGQTESWWGYERAIPLLAESFQVFAVDLRGQGRSTWTPGRYTLDNIGNDLVRFLDLVVKRPAIISGLSSGGVLSAWLSAYAKPGQVIGAVWEDPPLFASQTTPAVGPSIRQAMGPVFAVSSKWLGDQWSIGDVAGMQRAFATEVPSVLLEGLSAMTAPGELMDEELGLAQSMKEYDPEWARSFVSGLVTAGCDHERMLEHVRVPVLFTHHFHRTDEATGLFLGAIADIQVQRVRELVEAAGQTFTYRLFADMPHSMHLADPQLYADTVIEWVHTLPEARPHLSPSASKEKRTDHA